jgi:hypothetical protein
MLLFPDSNGDIWEIVKRDDITLNDSFGVPSEEI